MADEMTPAAREALDRYVERVRDRLRGTGLDAAEVVEDILDHVAAATARDDGPVNEDEVARVLTDLGPPDRWAAGAQGRPLPADDGSRRDGVGHGDGVRGLAILAFVVTVAGVAAFPWIGPLGLLIAWVLARATVARARVRGRGPGAWRWLVLPALVLFTAGVLAILVVAPIGPLAEAPLALPRWIVVAGGLATWYALLAALALLFRRAVRWLLFPALGTAADEPR